MVLSRAAALPKGLGRTVLRRAGSSTRNRSWRQVGRRGYASEHGHQEGSEIPWMIGSAAVTIPAAAWLLQQGPKKSDHGHGAPHEQHAEGEEEEEGGEEEQPKEEESKDDSGDDSKEEEKQDSSEDTDESKDESSDGEDGKSDDSGKEGGGDEESKSKGSDEEEYEAPGPNAPKQINWTSASNKGPGEGQKGERKPSEKKGEKDGQGNFSGAKHPYINDPEKSKKGVGVTETAKIHGTVDPSQGARGAKDSGSSSE